MTRPLFSIVIPTYNRAHAVGDAIQSCLAQTLDDFEIIVVDDQKSTDDIAAALARFAGADIRLLSRLKNTAAGNRNVGALAARGKYVAFLDSDDEFLPNKLEACLTYLERHPFHAVYSRTFVDRGVDRLWARPRRGLREGENIFEYFFIHKGWIHLSTLAADANVVREHPFREDLGFGDDTQFAADLAKSGVRLHMLEEPLAVYRDLGCASQLSQAPVYASADAPANKPFIDWVESQRAYMSKRAYHAYRAWYLARFVSRRSPLQALRFVWQAHRRGSMTSLQSAAQLTQVFMPRLYRRLANLVAGRAGQRVPSVITEMRARRAGVVGPSRAAAHPRPASALDQPVR